jgi:peptidoglycan/LPS O-acetylase OafA/YrhL
MNARLSSFLNASRWIAAFLVMIGHVRHLALVEYRDATVRTPIVKGVYFITGFGHEAVMVFFVISGYLVGGFAITRYHQKGFSLSTYVLHRFSRIYTVLVPALAVGGLLDLIGVSLFNESGLYTVSGKFSTASLNFSIARNLSLTTFLANIAMLEGIATARLGSNAPLWSLVYEWWYYVMFAAAMVGLTTNKAGIKIFAAIAFAALAVMLPNALLAWGVMWLVGVGTAVYAETRRRTPAPWLGLVVLMAALVASRLSHSSEATDADAGWVSWTRDFGVAVAFAFAILGCKRGTKSLPFTRVHEVLADFSYTLYLTHFPMFIFVMAAFRDFLGIGFLQQPSMIAYGYVSIICVIVVIYAWLFSRLTEAKTGRVRKAIF